ncbi:Hemicentin-1 [Chionoecetes opilio]|uniref:Hemicentin-1 n=1 Tax=Chionoecetes opilio TaxID=41210 RepID=A0A8J4XLR9_CHIOP|nr:Hemicentin-1 [Chionoecetes opilio]
MVAPTWTGGLPGRDYDKNKNENLTLSCPADGIPPPKVVWKKGDRTMVENNRLRMRNNHHLSFQILLPMDDGKYTCEVSNRAGSLAASFKVVVRDPEDQKTTIVLVVLGVLIAALVVLSRFF